MDKIVYLATSIPYVNAEPHIGYALETVQADALARFYRLMGYDVRFQIGTDENAIKNVESAQRLGLTTQDLVDKNAASFYGLKKILNLSIDNFIRTSSEKHKKGAQKFWQLCRHDIYKKEYRGLYCTGCEAFYAEDEFPDRICPTHCRKLEYVSEINYFFALSRYQSRIIEAIEKNEVLILPPHRRLEILNFLKEGIEDFSISRPKERTKGWGVAVPGDESQRMYVWFDALLNYLTGLNFGEKNELFQKYWLDNNNRFVIIGKDILKFHAVYWIAMLLSAKLPLQKKIYVHGFINVEGKKMSKSLGNVVNPYREVEKFGTDAVRYYLLREIPPFEDGDYSRSRMQEIYRADLANELGNLVLRLTTIAEQDQIEIGNQAVNEVIFDQNLAAGFTDFQFNKILETIWCKIKNINKEVDNFAPWKKNPDKRRNFLEKKLTDINLIGHQLLPFLPETAEKIIKATKGRIKKISPLFPRIV